MQLVCTGCTALLTSLLQQLCQAAEQLSCRCIASKYDTQSCCRLYLTLLSVTLTHILRGTLLCAKLFYVAHAA
jgi:hypothetical protein